MVDNRRPIHKCKQTSQESASTSQGWHLTRHWWKMLIAMEGPKLEDVYCHYWKQRSHCLSEICVNRRETLCILCHWYKKCVTYRPKHGSLCIYFVVEIPPFVDWTCGGGEECGATAEITEFANRSSVQWRGSHQWAVTCWIGVQPFCVRWHSDMAPENAIFMQNFAMSVTPAESNAFWDG